MIMGLWKEGDKSPDGPCLIASHQVLESGMPKTAIEGNPKVPAGAGPSVVDHTSDSTSDVAFEGDTSRVTPVCPLHTETKACQVVCHFKGNDPAALFIRLAPVKRDSEDSTACPAGKTGIVSEIVCIYQWVSRINNRHLPYSRKL